MGDGGSLRFKRIKDAVIRTFWGDAFYRLILRPIDAYLIPPQPSRSFAASAVPLNKVCRVADGGDPLWRRGFEDLGFPAAAELFHRKAWEFNQTLYGLRRLNRLAPDATALGIGCGHEELMYFLANRVSRVVATDLYEDAYLGGESDPDVIDHPAKYAPFKFREDRLEVRRMNGLALDVGEETFDFTFCLSSIEHFGSLADKLAALREMHRVLKPGGVAVLTTEIVLNRLGRGALYFRPHTLARLANQAGFVLDEPLDLTVEAEYADSPLALPMDAFTTPHVVLRNFHTIFTSVSLFLMKPSGPDPARNARIGDEVVTAPEPYTYRSVISAIDRPVQVRPGETIRVTVTVRNAGDAVWFSKPSRSHVVRAGAWLSTIDGRSLTGEPVRAGLPHDVAPGESVTLEVSLIVPADLAPKRVHLHVGLVKELCFWFRDRDGADLVVPLEGG